MLNIYKFCYKNLFALLIAYVIPSVSHGQVINSEILTFASKNSFRIEVPGNIAHPTELVSLDLGEMSVSSLIFIDAFSLLDKAEVGGDTLVLIRSSGSGRVLFAMDTIDLEDRRYVPANGRIQVWLHGIARVVEAGQITLVMKSSSAGSSSTTGRSQSQIRAYILNHFKQID